MAQDDEKPTLRDRFAMAALTGILGSPGYMKSIEKALQTEGERRLQDPELPDDEREFWERGVRVTTSAIAGAAYDLADAMLRVRTDDEDDE